MPSHRVRPAIAIAIAGATMTVLAATPTGAMASTTLVHFCDDDSQTMPLPDGAAWSTHLEGMPGSGVGGSNAQTPAATLKCFTITGRSQSMKGPGGYTSYIKPGTVATVVYTPPEGERIVAVAALQQAIVYENSYAEPGIYSSTGRPLTDTAPQLAGGELFDLDVPITLDTATLGSDGAAGISWGIRCPDALPAGRTECGGGQYGLTGTITLAHDDPPAPTPTPTPTVPVVTPEPTPEAPYAPALTSTSAPTSHQPPVAQRSTAPPHVTLTFARRHHGRSLTLSGTAIGCTRITLTLPQHHTLSIPVKSGRWQTHAKPRLGTYAAACSSAKAMRKRR